MKHPESNTELYEFNLGKARELRCLKQEKSTVCGECEACILTQQLIRLKGWFLRAGDQSRKRFTLGLVRRLHSVDLLDHITNLLQPLSCKDYMYAKSRTNPSLKTDRSSMNSDRALKQTDMEREIAEAWYWFQSANYWTKANYIMGVMQQCDAHLLSLIATQATTLLSSERNAYEPRDDFEIQSIASTEHSFDSVRRSDLDLLVTANNEYSSMATSPFSPYPKEQLEASGAPPGRLQSSLGDKSLSASLNAQSRVHSRLSNKAESEKRSNVSSPTRPLNASWSTRQQQSLSYDIETEIFNDETDDEGFGDDLSDLSSMDPACMVIPNSTKGHSGVAKHKDFVRLLPVHLSKFILGFLDQVSLHNCVCVSQKWRTLAEEVHKEIFVQQSLKEEVMLMQGAAAQGCNPIYAKDVDVTVPNLTIDTLEAIRTEEDTITTTFKSEVNFRTAYSGFSTRNIIMEERNVYCGAYNVLVLNNESDPSKVIHTDGGNWIAIGTQDRRIRFIHNESGTEVGPVISGHAGSVRSVAINQANGYVLSGSFDTSIRKWNLATGKCKKILRGHTDTVTCLQICGERAASGAKDNSCKVWLLETGKCIRTFKHKNPITAVALGEEMCLSGCEGGTVKVWNLKTGKLIKKLTGHHQPVTAIRFDKWHIVTGSKDGYALAWSAQGDHKRCLTALRHSKEVLCLEFMYLRVITGSADGKIRIWNMLTAQCLRIMRGNSKSDPILHLIAIDSRITINTPNNMLVLSFEPVDYDYTLKDDKMPPMVQYSKYSDAPIRHQPYSYIRAQRMRKAGATNTKIMHRDGENTETKDEIRPDTPSVKNLVQKPMQIPHSAKSLSRKSMEEAKSIHRASVKSEITRSSRLFGTERCVESRMSESVKLQDENASISNHQPVYAGTKSVSLSVSKHPSSKSGNKPRAATSFKTGTTSVVSVGGFQPGKPMSDSDVSEADAGNINRRVSWAFEKPFLLNKTKELSLNETKTLLRSQIRAKGEVVPPDFIYLAVNTIQANMRPTEANRNMESNRRDEELAKTKRLGRPSSSPSRIDPRTKIPVEDLSGWDLFRNDDGRDCRSEAAVSKLSARSSQSSKIREPTETAPTPTVEAYFTDFSATPVPSHPGNSSRNRIQSFIPKGRVIRPHTATAPRRGTSIREVIDTENRPKSAFTVLERRGTALQQDSAMAGMISVYGMPQGYKKQRYSTSATELTQVPLLMYSQEMMKKIQQLPERRKERMSQYEQLTKDPNMGKVSEFNGPMRAHAQFKLKTHEQVEKEMVNCAKIYTERKRNEEMKKEQKKKEAWLLRIKSGGSTKVEQDKNRQGCSGPAKTVVIVT